MKLIETQERFGLTWRKYQKDDGTSHCVYEIPEQAAHRYMRSILRMVGKWERDVHPPPPKATLAEVKGEEMFERLKAGKTAPQIAAELDVSLRTVMRYLAKVRHLIPDRPRQKGGRPTKA